MDLQKAVTDVPTILLLSIILIITAMCVQYILSTWNLPPGPWGFLWLDICPCWFYSSCWRLHHKITTAALTKFSIKRKPPIDDTITDEAQQLVDEPLQEKNAPMNPSQHINDAVASVILAITFGSRFEYRDDPFFKDFNRPLFDYSKVLGAGGYLGDLMPWLIPFTRGLLMKFVDVNNQLMNLVLPRIDDHLKIFHKTQLRDALDFFIQATHDTPESYKMAVGLTDEAILLTVASLIVPGMATVSSTLNWALLYMAYFPIIQEHVHAEIDVVLGSRRCATSGDRVRLPYTEACTLEIMRCSTIVPLLMPHYTICDTKLQGYFIPRNTLVFANVYSASYDKKIWESPDDFRPERFLSSDRTSVDQNATERFWPFGLGKRRCPGEYLGRLELFLSFVTLMRRCRFRVCPDHPVSFEPECTVKLDPQPYNIIIEARE